MIPSVSISVQNKLQKQALANSLKLDHSDMISFHNQIQVGT